MLERVRDKLRRMLHDTGSDAFTQVETYHRNKVFALTKNMNEMNNVKVNGEDLQHYTTDSENNLLTVDEDIIVGDMVMMTYTYFQYSNDELDRYISLAVSDITINSSYELELDEGEFTPVPNNRIQNLIARVAFIRINPTYSEYRTPNMTIKYPKTDDVDTKIQKLIVGTFSDTTYAGTMDSQDYEEE